MKPSFALSLSSTGITLLRRASGGWRNIGTVTFDSDDLDADLAQLRAQGLEYGEPLQSKLILPNDQIRYLTIETGDISDETRLAEVRLALADATPYQLHELAFDLCADGPRTHAAAVAYETLEEAEAFAQMHGFGPTSFVAQPDAADYLGEPFFGPAAAMQGVEIIPDGIAVVDIGPAEPPQPEGEDLQEADTSSEEEGKTSNTAPEANAPTPDIAVSAAQQDLMEAIEAEATADAEDELAPQAQMSQSEALAANDPAVSPKGPQKPSAPATIESISARLSARAAQALARDDLPDKVSPLTPTGLPETLDFGAVADLVSKTQAKEAPKAPTNAAVPTPVQPPEPETAPQSAPPVVGFSSRRTAPPEAVPHKREGAEDRPASRIPTLSAVRATEPSEKPAIAPAAAPVAPMPHAPASGAPAITRATVPASKPPALVAAAIAARTSDGKSKSDGQTQTAPTADKPGVLGQIKPKRIAVPADSQAARDAEAARAAYDADTPDESRSLARVIGGKPRFLGLMLTSLLLLFMAVVAAVAYWSNAGFDDIDPSLAPSPAPTLVPDRLEPTSDEVQQNRSPDTLSAPAPDAPADVDAEALNEPLLSDTAAPASDPEVAQPPAVDLSVETTEETTDTALTETDTAVLDALHDEEIAARPETPEAEDAAAAFDKLTPETDNDPEATADELAYLDPLAGPDLSDLTHKTTYAATGIWQKIPDVLTPDATASRADLDDVYVASIDKTSLSHDSIALPDGDRFETDLIQNALSSPLPEDSEFDLDDRGLVTATREGTLNPDGITVYLGRPAKVPPARPAPPEVAAPQAPQIKRIRPRPRPADLQDKAERARLGGLNLAELAKQRPRARPAGLQPPVQSVETAAVDAAIAAAQAEPAPSELPAATRLAVGSSVIPRARPSNFDRLVARAEETPQPSAPAVQATETVAPRLPTSASVSREATLANAIDLRKVNLIGISGSASDRRALVRLPSGNVKRVKVGDKIDGGRVTAIDSERLLYQKRGRNHTLRLPKG